MISVIIVTWNSARWLPACLASVARAIDRLSTDVWVVDNASTDDTLEVARRSLAGVNVIANPANLGFARAANQGMEASGGRYVLVLNPDAEISPDALRGMMAILDAHPDVGLVGCRLVGPGGETHECYGLTYPGIRNRSPAVRPRAADPELVEAAWLGGACILARRQAIAQVGGLDPDYFMYYEDVDWGLRMRRSGWRVVYWGGGEVTHQLGGCTRTVAAA
jgi:GT2 family glycosyltransferase